MTRKSKKGPPREGWVRGPEKAEADQLRWALRFAQADLAGWRNGDWLNAWEDATNFLLGGREFPTSGFEVYRVDEERSVEAPKTWLTRFQPALRRFIEGLYCGDASAISFTGKRVFEPHPEGLSRGLVYSDIPAESDLKKRFIPDMLLRLGDLLTRVDLSRLKRCPDCKRLFLAVRRQRFDTPQCSLRDRVRRFRTKARAAGPARARRKR